MGEVLARLERRKIVQNFFFLKVALNPTVFSPCTVHVCGLYIKTSTDLPSVTQYICFSRTQLLKYLPESDENSLTLKLQCSLASAFQPTTLHPHCDKSNVLHFTNYFLKRNALLYLIIHLRVIILLVTSLLHYSVTSPFMHCYFIAHSQLISAHIHINPHPNGQKTNI